MNYRSDIDGLRAVAVLTVLFFHVDMPAFKGGFVGVDVFFVISGYLITQIIHADLRKGRFSVGDFYRRRVLRIFPALLVLLAAVLLAGHVLLLPRSYADLGLSTVAATAFISNIQLYLQSDYFGTASERLPLLHTWSLAVEEQFYIAWPLVLWALHRWMRERMQMAVLVIALVSLTASQWWLGHDMSASFYMPHTRAWELLVGALLALKPKAEPSTEPQRLPGVVAGLGLVAVMYAATRYGAWEPFPGLRAVLPVAGTAAIILAGEHGPTWVGRLLSHPVATFIGKISFSLYLWHWPVVVFAKSALALNTHTLPVQIGIVAISIALGWLSWRFVEQPFRIRFSKASTPQVLSAGVLASLSVLAAGAVVQSLDGLPKRMPAEALAYESYLHYPGDSTYRGGTCFVVDPKHDTFDAAHCLNAAPAANAILLMGDSHGAHLWPGLSRHAGTHPVLQANMTGCRPVLKPATENGDCERFVRHMLTEWLPQNRVDTLILAGNWSKPDFAHLRHTLEAVGPHTRRVVVIGPVPQYTTDLPLILTRQMQTQDPQVTVRTLKSAPFTVDAQMRELVAGTRATYLSALDALCQPESGCTTLVHGTIPVQFDYGHLTAEGSELLIERLWPQIRSADH